MGSSLRMSTLLLPPSRPRELFNSLTGAQLVSSAVSTTNHLPLFQVAILPVSKELYAWFPTPLLLPRPFPVLITSLISCMPRELSSIGTLVREWQGEFSEAREDLAALE